MPRVVPAVSGFLNCIARWRLDMANTPDDKTAKPDDKDASKGKLNVKS